METLASDYPPWPDLLDPLVENILECLPIFDYARFAAVCRRLPPVALHPIRRRHSPYPPAMLRLPWLIPIMPDQNPRSCYCPFEDKSFPVSVPSSPFPHLDPFNKGWFFGNFTLYNPISRQEIELPRRTYNCPRNFNLACAISPPPNYIVSIIDSSSIYLINWFIFDWIKLELPMGAKPVQKMVSCGMKHYCISSDRCRDPGFYSYELLVVDAIATSARIEYFEMMGWSKMGRETWLRHGVAYFAEVDEEPLLVKDIVTTEKSCRGVTVGFEVFRADIGRKMWVKVESIGDRVLMIQGFRSVSLLAVDVGSKGNCIYFSTELRLREARWKVFDLGTGRVTDLPLPNASQTDMYYQQLFVPSLC